MQSQLRRNSFVKLTYIVFSSSNLLSIIRQFLSHPYLQPFSNKILSCNLSHVIFKFLKINEDESLLLRKV